MNTERGHYILVLLLR